MRLIIILLITIVLSEPSLASNVISAKKEELSAVNHQIASLKSTIQLSEQQQSDLQQQLKETEITIGKLGSQLNDLNQVLEKEKAELVKLKTLQQKTMDQLARENETLVQHVRAAYRLGETPEWKLALNQQNLSTIPRYLTYYRYLSEARLVIIAEIKKNLALLAETMRKVNARERTLDKLLKQKKTQQANQQNQLKLRQQLITVLDRQTQTKQQQLEALISNQKALEEMIRRLSAQITVAGGQPFTQLKGKLNWPVQGTVAADYGSITDLSQQQLNGIIIKASPGTPVHAIYAGKVIFANWLRGFGLLIIINHGNNFMSLYARNQALYVKAGDHVNTQDTIASIGNSGGYVNPGLYFEIRQNGNPVNPRVWCRG